MERRYLVAALAIIATFAGFSHGFRCLQHLSLLHAEHLDTMAKLETHAGAAANTPTRLRPGYAEEAQLLAEMNVPIATIEARVAEQMAKRDVAAAQCARATAMRNAERARRDAIRMRDKMRNNLEAGPTPISIEVNLADKANQQIAVNMAALASRLAKQQARLQIAANKLQTASVRIADPNVFIVDTDYDDQNAGGEAAQANCNHRNSSQIERIARDAMRQLEYSYNSK